MTWGVKEMTEEGGGGVWKGALMTGTPLSRVIRDLSGLINGGEKPVGLRLRIYDAQSLVHSPK